jgi:glycosyltransferase involved in cell wall biosynthesis
MIELKDKLELKNAEFFPFGIDTEKYSPKQVERDYVPQGHLLFFMPSHLDWGVTDNKPGRNSTKGNDRFIRAFARYVKEYGNAHAVILDRGPDKEIAKQLVAELGISNSTTFLPEMHKRELVRHFQMADVVVDQFEVGAFGFTGLEVMACAKPVLIYLKNECVDQCYPERPPVLNARTEEQIYQQIILVSGKVFRDELGLKAREWILKYHDGRQVAERLIAHYQSIIRR